MRIAIATVQVPFQTGGAFLLAKHLEAALIRAGHHATQITAPFRFQPDTQIERSMSLWQSEDFTDLNFVEPDLVIPLSFPVWGLLHPNKRAWVLHQHRAAYELFDSAAMSGATRERIHRYDGESLRQCKSVFTISKRVTERLTQSTHIVSTPLLHPPPDADLYYQSDEAALPYIFFPSRIESLKRQTLAVEAMQHVRSGVFLLIAGTGGQSGPLQERIAALNLNHKVRLLGDISEAEKRAYYARCTAVLFPPFDEDYGYVTLEAMLAAKPVITCADSGGPLEFVAHDHTGLVVSPEARQIALAIERLISRPRWGAELGQAGYAHYQGLQLNWDNVVSSLLHSK
jgi:glycosyltransferase involved in cell wall biosynthesis